MSIPSADGRRSVLVFRKRLLPYSETFIAAQGYGLQRYRAVFTGFQPDRRGLHHLRPEDCELLTRSRAAAQLLRLPLRVGARPSRGWIARLAAHRPALVHAHFGADGLAAQPLARTLGLPLAVTFHGHDIVGELRPRYRRQLRTLFSQPFTAIAVSRFIEQQLLRAGCPPEKIVQHYIGTDLSAFGAPRTPEAEPTLLFVGRLVEKKGVPYLLRAAAALQARIPQLRLRLIGDGPLRTALEAQASGLRQVEFLGAQPPDVVREHMRRAWVLCGPSVTTRSGDREGLGMVFLEAQASGLPVAGFRSGGIPEAVADGRTGLLVEEGDLAGLTESLFRILDDRALRERLSAEAPRHVHEHFELSRQCAKLETLYDRLIAASAAA